MRFRSLQAGPADVLDGMVHYLVDTPEGSVGVLDRCERDHRGRPTTLIVAQGWFGRRRLGIPIGKLIDVDHDRRRIVVAPGSAPLERKGLLQRLMEYGQERPTQDDLERFPPDAERSRPVLCGVADDVHASAVVAVAARVAKGLAAPLVVSHVGGAHIPPGVSAAPAGQARLRREEARDADQLLDELLSRVVPDSDVSCVIVFGPPAERLVELARTEDACFLVIGSTGKGLVSEALKGSVSRHVVAHAPCPVIVVPAHLPSSPRLRVAHDNAPYRLGQDRDTVVALRG